MSAADTAIEALPASAATSPSATGPGSPAPAAPLPTPSATTATAALPSARRATFAGLTLTQLALAALAILVAIWGMWVTRTLLTPTQQHIVKADLSKIVGNYVQAQARTDTPPERVEAEMRRFMASLDGELQRRGKAGQVVLVGEAVLSKNVTDITADVAKAVYASGVAVPRRASQPRTQVGKVLPTQGTAAPAQMAAAPQGGIGPVPGSAIFGGGPAPAPAMPDAGMASDPALSGAAVSVFGGGNGAGAR